MILIVVQCVSPGPQDDDFLADLKFDERVGFTEWLFACVWASSRPGSAMSWKPQRWRRAIAIHAGEGGRWRGALLYALLVSILKGNAATLIRASVEVWWRWGLVPIDLLVAPGGVRFLQPVVIPLLRAPSMRVLLWLRFVPSNVGRRWYACALAWGRCPYGMCMLAWYKYSLPIPARGSPGLHVWSRP